jgi:hypothetical protein
MRDANLSKIKTSSISSVLGLLISLLVLCAVCQTPLSFILSYAQESSPGESPIGKTPPSEKAPSIAQNQQKRQLLKMRLLIKFLGKLQQ